MRNKMDQVRPNNAKYRRHGVTTKNIQVMRKRTLPTQMEWRLCCRTRHMAYNALIGWEPLGPGMMHASFKTRMEKIQLNIIQCYAPTHDKDEGTKEDFYNKLQTVLDKMKEKDVTILMGDFNAKI